MTFNFKYKHLDPNTDMFNACHGRVSIAQIKEIIASDPKAINHATGVYNDTPFQLACYTFLTNSPDTQFLADLIKLGADPWQTSYQNNSVFLIAAEHCNVGWLNYLYQLDGCPDINKVKNYRIHTPLHVTCMRSTEKITEDMRISGLEWLIEHGADLSAKCNQGLNPIETAMMFKLNKVVDYLKPIYTEKNIPFRENLDTSKWYKQRTLYNRGLLHYASYTGDYDIAKELIALDKEAVNEPFTAINSTPIAVACSNGIASIEYLKLLIDNGADTSVLYWDNNSLILCAASFCRLDYLELLFNYSTNPNVNQANARGITPAMAACMTDAEVDQNKIIETLKFLSEKGANFNLKDQDGDDVMRYAQVNGYDEVVSYLETQGLKKSLRVSGQSLFNPAPAPEPATSSWWRPSIFN